MVIDSLVHEVKARLDDETNAQLDPGEYIGAIEQAILEFSGAYPSLQKTKLTTTADSMDLDVSSLTDRISVEGVEYPAGTWPRNLVPFEVWGNTLTMLLRSAPTSADDVYVYWGKKHTAETLPTQYTSLVALGSAGYVLQMLAMKKRHDAVSKIGTAASEIAKMISGGATDLAAAVDALSTAHTEIAKLITGGVGDLQDADTALDLAKDEIAKMVTGGTYTHTDVKTAIDKMATFLESDANKSVLVLLDKMNDLIYHATNLPNASKYLTDWDDYINAVTDGQSVAGHGAEYARAALSMAHTWYNKATGVYSVVNGYANQAMHKLTLLGNYAREAAQYMNEATGRLAVKGMYSREAQLYMNEAASRLNVLAGYAREGRALLDVSGALAGAADRYQKQADVWIAQFQAELRRVEQNRSSLPTPVFHFAW